MTSGSMQSGIILAAVSRVKSLDAVGLYAVMLAKRTDKKAFLLVVLNDTDATDGRLAALLEKKLSAIRQLSQKEGVPIRHQIAGGSFTEKVTAHLRSMDSPILVVGTGQNSQKRLQELKEIENSMVADNAWSHNHSHRFLMVTKRQQRSLLNRFCKN